MVEPKSRKIKKSLLGLEQKNIDHQAQSQKQKRKKVKILLKHNKDHLKGVNCILKKKTITTEKLLHLNEESIVQSINALKCHNQQQNNRAEEQVWVHFKLKNGIMLNEMKSIMIPLAYPIHHNLKVLFIVNEENQIQKLMEIHHPTIKFEIVKFQDIEKKKQKEFITYSRDSHIRLCDISVYKKFILMTKFQKSKNSIVFPFHATKVPFDIKSFHKVENYEDYLSMLIKSSFVYLYQEKDYSLEVASIKMKTEVIRENITRCIYQLVPHFMIHSKENHVTEILLSSDLSDKLKIY